MSELEVLDLFAGLEGWSRAFRDRGHRVTTLDFDPKFGSDHVRDILTVRSLEELERGRRFDVVLASPPCESFSVMTIGRNWTRDHKPKTDAARKALAIANHTFELIRAYRPQWWIVENPRGKLRRVAPMPPNATTWYCRWGMPYAKPTDLWTNLNGGMAMGWPTCYPNGADHEYAPRGRGIQGVGEVPSDAKEIRAALERGESVPGWKLIDSNASDHRRGLRLLVRTGHKTQRIDAGVDFIRQVGGGDDGFALVERPVSTGGFKRLEGLEIVEPKRRPGGKFDTRAIRDDLAAGRRVVGWRIGRDGSLRHRTRFELTSGTRKAVRALIPYPMALGVCLAVERGDGVIRVEEALAEAES